MEEKLTISQNSNLSNVHTLTGEKNTNNENNSSPQNSETFITYAYSRLGHECKANNDNFYCNGSYIKHFKYEDLKKSDVWENEIGIFAVCCDETEDDEGCKLVFKYLSEIQDDLNNCESIGKAKALTMRYIKNINRELLKDLEEKHCISLSLIVLFKNVALYFSCGNSVIIANKGKKGTKIMKQASDKFLGDNNLNIKLYTAYYDADCGFALCTKGIAAHLSEQDVAILCAEGTPKEIAVNIVKTVMDRKTEYNSTCVIIETCKKQKIKLASIIIMILCSVICCANIIAIIYMLVN